MKGTPESEPGHSSPLVYRRGSGDLGCRGDERGCALSSGAGLSLLLVILPQAPSCCLIAHRLSLFFKTGRGRQPQGAVGSRLRPPASLSPKSVARPRRPTGSALNLPRHVTAHPTSHSLSLLMEVTSISEAMWPFMEVYISSYKFIALGPVTSSTRMGNGCNEEA